MKNPIPPHARKVFTGKIFDVYQWEQEMFDGSRAIFEKIKRPDTASVIPVIDGKILMQREQQPNHQPHYGFPGGRIDAGEDPLAGAKRELLEEQGLVSDDWELYATYEPQSKIDWQIYTYIARRCRTAQDTHHEPGERISPHLVTFEEMIDIVCGDDFRGDDFQNTILRMRLDPPLLGEFRELLLGR